MGPALAQAAATASRAATHGQHVHAVDDSCGHAVCLRALGDVGDERHPAVRVDAPYKLFSQTSTTGSRSTRQS